MNIYNHTDQLDLLVSKPTPSRSLIKPSKFDIPDLNNMETDIIKKYLNKNNNEKRFVSTGLSMLNEKTSISLPRKYSISNNITDSLDFTSSRNNSNSNINNINNKNSNAMDIDYTYKPPISQLNPYKNPHKLIIPLPPKSISQTNSQPDLKPKSPRIRASNVRHQSFAASSTPLNIVPVVVPASSLALLKSRMRSFKPADESNQYINNTDNITTNNNPTQFTSNYSQPRPPISPVVEVPASSLALLKKRMHTSVTSNESDASLSASNSYKNVIQHQNNNNPIKATKSYNSDTPAVAALKPPQLFKPKLEIKPAAIIALNDGKVSIGGYEYDPSQAEVSEPVNLEQCPSCERKFNPTSIDRHIKVCKKVFVEKEEKIEKIVEKEIIAKPNNKWKKNNNVFRNSLRAAREYNDAIKKGIEPPPMPVMEVDDDLVECPHCLRRFAPTTAERHIPHCANTKAKPSILHRGTGKSTTSKR